MRPPHPFDLTGRVALVTGAGSGLGLEIARALAAAGARVALNGRGSDALDRAVDLIRGEGAQGQAVPFDVTDSAAASRAVGELLAERGRIDILVNNVGMRDRRPLFDFALADVRKLLEVDLIGPLHLSREVAKAMIAVGEGRIINITSIAGPLARSGDAAYTTAKGGLEALTRAMAAELGPHGITVNAIAPGYFATEANTAQVEDRAIADWLAQRSSLGRWGQPHEVAGAAVFLASPAAAYITGQVLAVDGGFTTHF